MLTELLGGETTAAGEPEEPEPRAAGFIAI